MSRTALRVVPLLALLIASPAAGKPGDPSPRLKESRDRIIDGVGVGQNLDAPLPLDATFRDEAGAEVRLGDYFGDRPVIVTLVYYNCPMLCTIELNGVLKSLKGVSYDIGRQVEVVTISIDPTETPELAGRKKAAYVRRYGRPGAAAGWHFLTGEEASIRRVAEAIDFRYRLNPETKQYAHGAGFVVATPSGRISRYFYGVQYPPRDLKLAVTEAAGGKIGSPIERLMLLCYHYDPRSGRYTFAVMNALKVLGAATVLSLGTFMVVMFRRDLSRRGADPDGGAAAIGPVS